MFWLDYSWNALYRRVNTRLLHLFIKESVQKFKFMTKETKKLFFEYIEFYKSLLLIYIINHYSRNVSIKVIRSWFINLFWIKAKFIFNDMFKNKNTFVFALIRMKCILVSIALYSIFGKFFYFQDIAFRQTERVNLQISLASPLTCK